MRTGTARRLVQDLHHKLMGFMLLRIVETAEQFQRTAARGGD